MKKWVKYSIVIIIFLAGLYAVYTSIVNRTVPMKQFISVCNGEQGDCIASWYDKDKIVIARINGDGNIEKYVSFDAIKNDTMYNLAGLSAGPSGLVYVLRNSVNCYTGELLTQDLVVVDLSGLLGKVGKSFSLSDEEENYEYKWINTSGDTITLIATDMFESTAVRKNFEYGSVLSDTLTLKNTRTYPIQEGDGIYKAIGNSENLVYISDSGKIFYSTEESVTEVYPARDLTTLMYPTFIAYAESGFIYMGEHESGNISRLNLATGDETVVQNGNNAFAGASRYTPKDILTMSMSSFDNFTSVVYDAESDNYTILVSTDGYVKMITQISHSIFTMVFRFLKTWAVYLLIGLIGLFILAFFVSAVKNGKTIMGRLLVATLPLIFAAMALFGYIAFSYYKNSIDQNFEKQTTDEGNLLTALFGQESFNEIEYPYDYSSDAYKYLITQLKTRDMYTRIVYYEDTQLYLGVDKNEPCFYPFDILLNENAKKLYLKAALTGNAVNGVIQDELGERIVCITPVGGMSGETVYLLETGIFSSNINQYVKSYVGNFILVCGVFLVITLIVLCVLYYRILLPLGEIKWVMGQFNSGKRDMRLDITSEDELAGISRIFNSMADDMMFQIHNLEKMGETYYRFVPVSVISLLGKDNLADLSVGSKIEGNYAISKVNLNIPANADKELTEKLTNRFFNTINHYAVMNEVVPVVDNAKVSSMIMICRKGMDSAIVTALSVLAKVDADNMVVDNEEVLNVSFILHKTDVSFGIAGNDDRYVLSVLAPEFEQVLTGVQGIANGGSRVLLTSSAVEGLNDADGYAKRYIGCIHIGNKDMGAYDIYDDKNADEIKLMKVTQRAFDKAMELYEKGSYYEAKNLFAMVLRENNNDLIAKQYIFRCEELQNKQQ